MANALTRLYRLTKKILRCWRHTCGDKGALPAVMIALPPESMSSGAVLFSRADLPPNVLAIILRHMADVVDGTRLHDEWYQTLLEE